MESTLVIKVKYGDTLRRFNARVNDNHQLDLDMGGLRAKILGLFNFPLDADLNLTYVDEDGDLVTLVDDDDLHDVMRQCLKFLRIDVQLNNDKFGKSYARSSGNSTPMRSPRVPNPLSNINTGVAEVLKSVPEPVRETLSKLSLDLASKAATSNSVLVELVDCFSKVGQSYLNPALQSQVGADSSTQTGPSEVPTGPSAPTAPNTSNDGGMQEVLLKSNPPSKTSGEVSIENLTSCVGASPAPACAPVDLNQDPTCDTNPSGCATVKLAAYIPADDDRKESKEDASHTSKKSVSHGASAGFAIPFGSFGCAYPWTGISNTSPGGRPLFLGASTSSTSPVISFEPRPFGNECPFSGLPVANESAVPPSILSPCHPFKRSNSRNDAAVGIFHRGVQCDGCGALPITGPRYKSKVKEDYDLCSFCFAEMGNEADYIKMDKPMPYRHPMCLRGLNDANHWAGLPPRYGMRPRAKLDSCPPRYGMRPRAKLDSCFIMDVNVLDGTMMAPSTHFTKIWRMRNSGSVPWPQGARLVWIGGDRFSHEDSAQIEIPVDGVPMDGEIDIAVDFTSPELPGRYISYWRMASPSGTKFGQRVWVLIQVDASAKDSPCDSPQDLNLNLPPDCSDSKCPEITDVNAQPVIYGSLLEPRNSTSASEPIKPIVDKESKKDQEMDFPINDSLLIGHGVSLPASSPTSSSLSYPMIDFSELAPTGASVMDDSTSSKGVNVNDAVEKTLLKELEDMGFKQVDLNKEILRMNEYNLMQSVDDLCGVAEWDPILEELQEMGFCDKEMNRKLLKKNNGSIKRVVMDLLTGEKA